jgi:DNA polymerase type B, organellar and viral.
MEIYEIWNFKEKSNNFFKEHVKDFMKIKLETSPWESDFKTCHTTVKNCLGIDLDHENIAPNPGKQAVAKICLNSLCGKFGQRQNMTKPEYVSDAKRYQILLDN